MQQVIENIFNDYTFEKPEIEDHIFDRATITGFAMREFRTK